MLSAHEQRVLASIEQHFLIEDPRLYARLQHGPGKIRSRRLFRVGWWTVAFGILLLVMGTVSSSPSLMVLGFLFGGAGWMTIVLARGKTPEQIRGHPPTWGPHV